MRSNGAVQVVILGAGLGSRLGRPLPKPLTRLEDGRTILERQVEAVRTSLGEQVPVTVVVGFMADAVMRAAPHGVRFVHNDAYATTNTSKSLLAALRGTPPGGVLWLNGDVVLDAEVLDRGRQLMAQEQTVVWVNTAAVGDEEVKYTLDDRGFVRELSKTVRDGLGEAVGVNYVAGGDRALLAEHLDACGTQDYFERGLETAIATAGLRVRALDISGLLAIEVDDEADLARANRELTRPALAAD
jgi:choline kinase